MHHQCVAPLAANSPHSGLSRAISIASSKARLCRDRSFFRVAIQEEWGHPTGLLQSLWGTAVRTLPAMIYWGLISVICAGNFKTSIKSASSPFTTLVLFSNECCESLTQHRQCAISWNIRSQNNADKTHLCVAPAKHRGFDPEPTRTQDCLSHGLNISLPAFLLLPSSTLSWLFGVFASLLTFFVDPLPVSGVLGLPGSGADKRLSFEYFGFGPAE